jgi:hypothetical protein
MATLLAISTTHNTQHAAHDARHAQRGARVSYILSWLVRQSIWTTSADDGVPSAGLCGRNGGGCTPAPPPPLPPVPGGLPQGPPLGGPPDVGMVVVGTVGSGPNSCAWRVSVCGGAVMRVVPCSVSRGSGTTNRFCGGVRVRDEAHGSTRGPAPAVCEAVAGPSAEGEGSVLA